VNLVDVDIPLRFTDLGMSRRDLPVVTLCKDYSLPYFASGTGRPSSMR
jgi:hypothetical protein